MELPIKNSTVIFGEKLIRLSHSKRTNSKSSILYVQHRYFLKFKKRDIVECTHYSQGRLFHIFYTVGRFWNQCLNIARVQKIEKNWLGLTCAKMDQSHFCVQYVPVVRKLTIENRQKRMNFKIKKSYRSQLIFLRLLRCQIERRGTLEGLFSVPIKRKKSPEMLS